jgi:hypothetical protein
MSAAECAKRASDCLKAAESSSDDKGRRIWQQLADAWTAWSETVGRLNKAEQRAARSNSRPFEGHSPSLDYNRTSGLTEQRPAAANEGIPYSSGFLGLDTTSGRRPGAQDTRNLSSGVGRRLNLPVERSANNGNAGMIRRSAGRE